MTPEIHAALTAQFSRSPPTTGANGHAYWMGLVGHKPPATSKGTPRAIAYEAGKAARATDIFAEMNSDEMWEHFHQSGEVRP
jgi:hypothetical protein